MKASVQAELLIMVILKEIGEIILTMRMIVVEEEVDEGGGKEENYIITVCHRQKAVAMVTQVNITLTIQTEDRIAIK